MFQNFNCLLIKAPGKPTKDNGFISTKKWDGKQVKSYHGVGYRWPDKERNIWVPSGENCHGCLYWEVQAFDGSITILFP